MLSDPNTIIADVNDTQYPTTRYKCACRIVIQP